MGLTNNEQKLLNLAFTDVQLFRMQIDRIVNEQLSKIDKLNTLKKIFTLLDITTLRDNDYKESIVNLLRQSVYNLKDRTITVAGVCIYSNLLSVLNSLDIDKRIRKVVVSGGFPNGQLSLIAKLNDIAYAIENSADEIDIPINRGLFFENHKELEIELNAIRKIIEQKPNVKLKVILETSELGDYKNIYEASNLVINCGSDFIKTSTGKVSRGADIYSSAVMILAIKKFNDTNYGSVIGFKAAGGIREISQALQYYCLMQYFFSEQYITKDTFRIGCSNLANEIINNLQQ